MGIAGKRASSADDDQLRRRVIDAAAELFAEFGFSGTKVAMVAKRAGVDARTVRRLTGGRAELFDQVMASKVISTAAERVAAAASDPGAAPPLAVILAAAQEVFSAPERSWDVLELEALTRAQLDEDLRTIEAARIQRRWDNTRALISQVRANGGLDPDLADNAVVHFALALSAGLAMLDPVLPSRPTLGQWNTLMARIGASLAPHELLLAPDHQAGTPWRVRVDVPDRPGAVARLIRALATLHAYTVALYVIGSDEGYRTIDVALTAPHGVTPAALRAVAMSAGRNGHVMPGSLDDALDLPTRILDAATELVTNPGWAPLAAAALVEADEVEVADATEGQDDRVDVLRLQWTTDRHVVLQRDWAPFARAERTRASALLRLSAAIASLTGESPYGWVEPITDGTVGIRLARPEDSDAVAAMHERCSERSRYQRYFSVVEWRDVQLRRLSGGHRGATLVVTSDDDTIIGLGNVFPDEPGDSNAAEIALIVEDAYQGRGVGRQLLTRMLDLALHLGFGEVVAVVLADNGGMLHLLRSTGLQWTSGIQSGVTTMRAPLRGAESEAALSFK
jgi:AcrR family transcriptional regulator/RimJ/RimL family protein N-acetyltransferase